MSRKLRDVVLPGGLAVTCRSEREAALVNEQVQLYFRHGIHVDPGATVIDAGANIGLFTLLVQQRCRGDVDVYAVEPMPASLDVLRKNVARSNSDRIRVLACGLGAVRGSAMFAYYPHHTTLSSAYGSATDEDELSEQLGASFLRNKGDLPFFLRLVARLPQALRRRLMRWLIHRSFRGVESIRCEIRTVSDIMAEHGVTRVDILKVDVEKAELDVLRGILATDWPKVQQVVMELHDLDGRLETVKALLKDHGLSHVVVEQEPVLRGSNVYALYAARSPLTA